MEGMQFSEDVEVTEIDRTDMKEIGRPHSVASVATGCPSPGPWASGSPSATPEDAAMFRSRPATTEPPSDSPDRAWQCTPARPQSEQGHRARPGARGNGAVAEGDDRRPKTDLAAITSFRLPSPFSEGQSLVVPYGAGAGFPSLFGPVKPASHSPCESALHKTTLTSHPIPQLKTVSKTEAALERDKERLSARYQANLTSRFQPLPVSSARYNISLPGADDSLKYSKTRETPDTIRFTQEVMETQGNRGRKALKMGELQVKKTEVRDSRPGQQVQYNLKRLEMWFKLMDINNSGEVTVRKLIVGMLKHQELLDLFYLLKDGGSDPDLDAQNRPKIGQLTKADMEWVSDVLSDLDQDGNASMDWPEFVDFFRKTGLLLEYKTRPDLNESMMGQTSMESARKTKDVNKKQREGKWLTEERRKDSRKDKHAGRASTVHGKEEASTCSAAQTT